MAPKYVFCVSPGRSGSNYLSKIFDHAKGWEGLHEPQPVMNCHYMSDYLKGNKETLKLKMPEKFEQIYRDSGENGYFESNHCFIKGFGWEIFSEFDQNEVLVISLKRDRDKVVNSYMRIGSDPIWNDGLNWFITPLANSYSKPPIGPIYYKFRRHLSRPYYWMVDKGLLKKKVWIINRPLAKKLLEWYYDESYLRLEAFRKMFPDCKVIEARIEDFNSLDSIQKILSKNGLTVEFEESVHEVLGKPSNLKR
jgi:hypothetical protein